MEITNARSIYETVCKKRKQKTFDRKKINKKCGIDKCRAVRSELLFMECLIVRFIFFVHSFQENSVIDKSNEILIWL